MLPRFVFRVDSRPPEIIFREGFRPWGDNYDFLGHLSGDTNIQAWSTGLDPSDAYISTSENDVTALQFLRTVNHESLQAETLWLYEIRPTNNFYSVMNMSRYYFTEIINGRYNFNNPNMRDVALSSLSSSAERFHLEGEWVSTQEISSDLIVSARRIDMTNFRRGLPIWDSEVINNQNYVNIPSEPNPGIFTHPEIIDEFMLDMTEGFQDNGNGFIASGGFLLLSTHSHFNRKKRETENDEYIQSYFLKNRFRLFKNRDIINMDLKISFPISQQIPMIDVKDNRYKYKLTNYNYQITNADWAYLTEKKDSSPWLIFDQYGRLGYYSLNHLIFYCLDAGSYSDGDEWDYLRFNPGIINYEQMQWDLKLSEDKKYLRLVNKKFPNFILGYKKGYLIIQKSDQGYDEMAIDWNNLALKDLINKSYVNNNYEWFDLRWVWDGTIYYPNLSGGSFSTKKNYHILFYRELGYILFVDNNDGSVYALTNKRNSDDDWDWIKWELLEASEFINLPSNINRMWKIDYIDEVKGIVKINSYNQDDILWIQTNSTNWGYYFTSKKDKDYSSKASTQHFAAWKK